MLFRGICQKSAYRGGSRASTVTRSLPLAPAFLTEDWPHSANSASRVSSLGQRGSTSRHGQGGTGEKPTLWLAELVPDAPSSLVSQSGRGHPQGILHQPTLLKHCQVCGDVSFKIPSRFEHGFPASVLVVCARVRIATGPAGREPGLKLFLLAYLGLVLRRTSSGGERGHNRGAPHPLFRIAIALIALGQIRPRERNAGLNESPSKNLLWYYVSLGKPY